MSANTPWSTLEDWRLMNICRDPGTLSASEIRDIIRGSNVHVAIPRKYTAIANRISALNADCKRNYPDFDKLKVPPVLVAAAAAEKVYIQKSRNFTGTLINVDTTLVDDLRAEIQEEEDEERTVQFMKAKREAAIGHFFKLHELYHALSQEYRDRAVYLTEMNDGPDNRN